MLESLIMSSVHDADRNQNDPTENKAEPHTTVSAQPIVHSNTLTPDTVDSTVTNDNESEPNPIITDMDHETTPYQPVPSTMVVSPLYRRFLPVEKDLQERDRHLLSLS